jgi:hypothetical protein
MGDAYIIYHINIFTILVARIQLDGGGEEDAGSVLADVSGDVEEVRGPSEEDYSLAELAVINGQLGGGDEGEGEQGGAGGFRVSNNVVYINQIVDMRVSATGAVVSAGTSAGTGNVTDVRVNTSAGVNAGVNNSVVNTNLDTTNSSVSPADMLASVEAERQSLLATLDIAREELEKLEDANTVYRLRQQV